MKGLVLWFMLMITGSVYVVAQGNPQMNQKAMQQIEAARIAMITERLGLTPDQAQQFWPMYNEFAQKRREIRARFNEARQGVDPKNMTEEESQRLMNMSLEIRQSEVNLEREYTGKFRDVISAQQVLALRKAEEDFRRLILRRIEDRQRQQMNRQMMLDRQNDRRQRGNN